MKKLFIPLAILMIAILTLVACGGDETTTTGATTPGATTTTTTMGSTTNPGGTTTAVETTSPEAEKYGGTLKYIYGLSPNSTPGWPGDSTNLQKLWMTWTCFEPLVRLGADGAPIPWLSTEWEWGPDNAYITFTLRQNVKFHDGTTFTSESVKVHTDQLILDTDSSTVNWDRWEVIDDYTIRLYLEVYMTDFWGSISNWAMLFTSDTSFKAHDLDYVKEHPIGTGPFKFESFDKDVSLKFVRFDNYWQEGKPYLDAIHMITVKEGLTQQAKMEAGEGDMLALQQGKVLQDMENLGFNVVSEYAGTNWLMFDTANDDSITNDPLIRMAIEHAINKPEMVEALGYGKLKMNNQIMPPGNPGYNDAIPNRDYDPAKSRELLAEAGYPDGFKLTLISDSLGTDIALYLQQYLGEVGIELKLDMVDNAKYWNYSMTGWTGVLNAGYATGTNFPSFIRGYFPPIGVIDVSCEIPQDILDKCAAAMVETDPVKFKALSDEIAVMIYDRCLFVPMYSNAMGNILNPRVKDAGCMQYVDFSVWNPADTWLSDE